MRSAAERSIAAFGVIAGIAGIEHGVGAILQGNVAPDGVIIESWPDAPAYEILSGEPAMTLVPSLLASGVLTVLVSIVLVVWAVRYVGRPRGGLVLIGTSVVLLLVGGGFGPPILGAILGVAATRIGARGRWLERFASEETRATLATRWRSLLVASVASWLSLWPGVPLLHYLFGFADALLVVALTLSSFALLLATLLAALARDGLHTAG